MVQDFDSKREHVLVVEDHQEYLEYAVLDESNERNLSYQPKDHFRAHFGPKWPKDQGMKHHYELKTLFSSCRIGNIEHIIRPKVRIIAKNPYQG